LHHDHHETFAALAAVNFVIHHFHRRKEKKDLIVERQSGQIKTRVAGSGPQPSNFLDRRSLPNILLLQKPQKTHVPHTRSDKITFLNLLPPLSYCLSSTYGVDHESTTHATHPWHLIIS
jgi:hypothetical protein